VKELLGLCRRRALGEPIQYILGSQPFGDLDIKCRPGVLIPRPETEAYTMHLANLLNEKKLPGINYAEHVKGETETGPEKPLRILDICSGSGCISLLLHSILSERFRCEVTGLDISPKAIKLASENAKAVSTLSSESPKYYQRDIFEPFHPDDMGGGPYDIVISNPPYISLGGFKKSTTRSVRNWEPKLALVPEVLGKESITGERTFDRYIFYRRILQLHLENHQSKCLIMEVGGKVEAIQVVHLARQMLRNKWQHAQQNIQIWTDHPGDFPTKVIKIRKPDCYVRVQGTGNYRAVVVFAQGVKPETTWERCTLGPIQVPHSAGPWISGKTLAVQKVELKRAAEEKRVKLEIITEAQRWNMNKAEPGDRRVERSSMHELHRAEMVKIFDSALKPRPIQQPTEKPWTLAELTAKTGSLKADTEELLANAASKGIRRRMKLYRIRKAQNLKGEKR